ncbi:MAG: HAMP domain-containing histidine kinase [Sedimentisphaerales bacterium]|nr:HAMP domain-containing histidine kinase [Sedimentisphaerales bacterium]
MSRYSSGNSYSQLRRVVLLLGIVVILPTLCLVWFLLQTVKNERLAVRQRLIDFYQVRLDDAADAFEKRWLSNLEYLKSRVVPKSCWPYEVITDSAERITVDGLLIFDRQGNLLYPLIAESGTSQYDLPSDFDEAWELEFVSKDIESARRQYQLLADRADSEWIRIKAIMGLMRCLKKSGRLDEAIQRGYSVVNSVDTEWSDPAVLTQIGRIRIMLVGLLKEAGSENFTRELFRLLAGLEDGRFLTSECMAFPSSTRIFMFNQAITLAEDLKSGEGITEDLNILREMLIFEELSRQAASADVTMNTSDSLPEGKIEEIQLLDDRVYGMRYSARDRITFVFFTPESLRDYLNETVKDLEDSLVSCGIRDFSGRQIIAPADSMGETFIRKALSDTCLSGWQVELYYKNEDVFKSVADKQAALYIWSAILVIAIITGAGILAGRSLNRQIKLNRLKNDFIATVSHELKTPLASMRLLVDTLLEGRYRDQQQVHEYLELVSRENHRLSRMIENFLSFSRMERNKLTLDKTLTHPKHIINDAINSVKTGYHKSKCHLEVEIADDLPEIWVDPDGMVTVLVNLLDNACKYTYDDKKQIRLRVYHDQDRVCFEVSDNGMGMSKRTVKKIFDRFYQADQSLSRRTEGCGLGLSIVKFIIDAHRGKISVQSKPGDGSTFTVSIPANNHK